MLLTLHSYEIVCGNSLEPLISRLGLREWGVLQEKNAQILTSCWQTQRRFPVCLTDKLSVDLRITVIQLF